MTRANPDSAIRSKQRRMQLDPNNSRDTRFFRDHELRLLANLNEDLQALLELLSYDQDRCRQFAVSELGTLLAVDSDAVLVLLRAFRDSSRAIRRHAAEALSQLPKNSPHQKQVARELVEVTADKFPDVRLAAAKTLAKIDIQETVLVEALTEVLASDDEDVCTEAVKRLTSLGKKAKNSVAALYRSVKNKSEAYHELVRQSAETIRKKATTKRQTRRKPAAKKTTRKAS